MNCGIFVAVPNLDNSLTVLHNFISIEMTKSIHVH